MRPSHKSTGTAWKIVEGSAPESGHGGAFVGLAEREMAPGSRRGVLCVAEARWLRWSDDILEVGDDTGVLHSLVVCEDELMLVGRAFGPIALGQGAGRRLLVAARFAGGATILIERRGARTAVAASPKPRPRAVG